MISYYLQKNKPRKKDGKVAIFISVSSHLGRIRRPTGISVSIENWEQASEQVKKKEAFASGINARLGTLKVLLNDFIFKNTEIGFSLIELEYEIMKFTNSKKASDAVLALENRNASTFSDFCDFMNEKQKYEIAKNTISARVHLAATVSKFDGSILLKDINEKWIGSFRGWLIHRGIINNTVNLYVSRLNSVLKYAYENKFIDSPPPKIRVLKSMESSIIFLTSEELVNFENCVYGKNKHLLESVNIAKDYFLFMCYTGIRFSDFFLLTKSNIKASHGKYTFLLDFIAKKNNLHVVCPLIQKAKDIIDKYANESSLLFPLITKTMFINNIKKHAERAGILSEMKQSHYIANNLIQINTPKYKILSPHAARHTFATQYIANGGNIIYLQKLLGHTNLDMTQKYVELLKPNIEDDFFSVFGL